MTSRGALVGLTGSWPGLGFDVEAMIEAESDALVEWLEHNPSCSLDVAEEGEQHMERIGEWFRLTRQRVQQIEARALAVFLHRAPDGLRQQFIEVLESKRESHHLGWVDEKNEPEVEGLEELRALIRKWEKKQGEALNQSEES